MTHRVRATSLDDLRNAWDFAELIHAVRTEHGGEHVLGDVARSAIRVPFPNALQHLRELFLFQRPNALSETSVAVRVVVIHQLSEHAEKCSRTLKTES
jgi:hypothetical protein